MEIECNHVWDYEYPIKTNHKGKVYIHFRCRQPECRLISMKNKDGTWTNPTLNSIRI